MDATHCPLAYDRSGERIAVDESAAWFRVTYTRQGHVAAVADLESGGPLYLALTATPAELRERSGPGTFTLIQCDENRDAIKDAAKAFVEIPAERSAKGQPAKAGEPDALTSTLATSINALVATQEATRNVMREVCGALTGIAKVNTEALSILSKLATGQPMHDADFGETVIEVPAQPDVVKQALEVIGPLVPFAVAYFKKKLEEGDHPTPAAQLVEGAQP